MTDQRETTRYATPSLRLLGRRVWLVTANPWDVVVGTVREHEAGCTALTHAGRVLGLYPHKQAAAEVLVKQAGYELEMG